MNLPRASISRFSAPGPGDVCVEMEPIGHFGHKRFGEAHAPPAIIVLNNYCISVAARVCRIVVRAIVVDRPVQELQVAVGAPGIQV